MSDLQSALLRNGIIIAAIGLVFALAVLPIFHPAAWLFLQLAYWPLTDVPEALAAPAGLLVAITGGLTMGIGAVMWALGTYVTPISAGAARWVTTTMGWAWFSVDSTASILAGAPMNVVLNLVFLVLILQAARVGRTTEGAAA